MPISMSIVTLMYFRGAQVPMLNVLLVTMVPESNLSATIQVS